MAIRLCLISLSGLLVGIIMSLLQLGAVYFWSVIFAHYVFVCLYFIRCYKLCRAQQQKMAGPGTWRG